MKKKTFNLKSGLISDYYEQKRDAEKRLGRKLTNKEFEDKYLKIEMGKANPRTLTRDDYDMLIHCGCMFARKFNDANIDLIDRILLSYQDN